MLAIGIVLSVFGLGFFCWLLFTLASYALPFLAGLTAGLAAFHSGAGVIGALIVGFLVGGAHAADPRHHRSALRSAGNSRRLSGVGCAVGHRHVRRRLADGICRCRRRSLWRHGLLAHDAVCPGVGRTGHWGSSLADCLAAARPETLTVSATSSSNKSAKVGGECSLSAMARMQPSIALR